MCWWSCPLFCGVRLAIWGENLKTLPSDLPGLWAASSVLQQVSVCSTSTLLVVEVSGDTEGKRCSRSGQGWMEIQTFMPSLPLCDPLLCTLIWVPTWDSYLCPVLCLKAQEMRGRWEGWVKQGWGSPWFPHGEEGSEEWVISDKVVKVEFENLWYLGEWSSCKGPNQRFLNYNLDSSPRGYRV